MLIVRRRMAIMVPSLRHPMWTSASQLMVRSSLLPSLSSCPWSNQRISCLMVGTLGFKNPSVALEEACRDYSLQVQLWSYMQETEPRPSICTSEFIADKHQVRAHNVLPGPRLQTFHQLGADIKDFMAMNRLDKVYCYCRCCRIFFWLNGVQVNRAIVLSVRVSLVSGLSENSWGWQ